MFEEPKPLVQTCWLMFPVSTYTGATLFLIHHKLIFWTLGKSTDCEHRCCSNVKLLVKFLNAFSQFLYLSHCGRFTPGHSSVDNALSRTALAISHLFALPTIPHLYWSPLFWTGNHTEPSFPVHSLRTSLKHVLKFVFWYHSLVKS